jgi:hypothetical protein
MALNQRFSQLEKLSVKDNFSFFKEFIAT